MKFYAYEIVADARSIELELFHTESERAAALVQWFNNHVENGGLGDIAYLPGDAPAELAAQTIEEVTGRPVLLSEVFV